MDRPAMARTMDRYAEPEVIGRKAVLTKDPKKPLVFSIYEIAN